MTRLLPSLPSALDSLAVSVDSLPFNNSFASSRALAALSLPLTSLSFSTTILSSTFVVKHTVKHLLLASAKIVATLVSEIFYSSEKTAALCISNPRISFEISIVVPSDLQST